ncbi:amino acid/polyamine transporter I [Hypoxylon trugodes]|uniref:amino acid/polyamine transporter I n=1 Tax=Hypoxylon trugodes TaxID=326681 RepID=UPI00219B9F19|nr:amino acid/polyamine transporter I [Hypoxylon trugodes]KAI1391555.1 amino acid/polyamine transporter I [Hypoxylon trugodes]
MAPSASETSILIPINYTPNTTLPRTFTPLSLFALSFTILNSWGVLSASLPLSLSSGGPSAAIWGLLIVGAGNLCLATSLAEFLSAYPSAGGQYHWVYLTAPPKYARCLAWLTGWVTVFGWIAVAASASLLSSQLVVGLVVPREEGVEVGPLGKFGMYAVMTLVFFAVNVWMSKGLPALNKVGLLASVTGLLVIPVVALTCSWGRWAEPEFVFGGFINETGWPDGIAWLIGFLQAGVALNGFDAVSHVIEEIPNAPAVGPKVMIGSVAMGILTGFYFLVTILFSSGGADEIENIIHSPLGPLMVILYNSTGSHAVATALLVFLFICGSFGGIAITTTSSRMVFAFARDGGLPASHIFEQVHARYDIPFNALCLSAILTGLLGCIFLISSTAFSAISSASVVTLTLSYCLPVITNCAQGRKKLPARVFALPHTLGWIINIVGISYALLTSVLFLLPAQYPITRDTMNYGSVALALVLFLSVASWMTHGRKSYAGSPTLGNRQISDLMNREFEQESAPILRTGDSRNIGYE